MAVKVYVLCKIDAHEHSDVLGVFASLEVAKTIGEAEEPGRNFLWEDQMDRDVWTVASGMKPRPIYSYDIELFEVRHK